MFGEQLIDDCSRLSETGTIEVRDDGREDKPSPLGRDVENTERAGYAESAVGRHPNPSAFIDEKSIRHVEHLQPQRRSAIQSRTSGGALGLPSSFRTVRGMTTRSNRRGRISIWRIKMR